MDMSSNPSDELKHECAIYVAYGEKAYIPSSNGQEIIENVINGLIAQSNRGQEGFGIASVDPDAADPFSIFRSGDSINSLLNPLNGHRDVLLKHHSKKLVMGHNRYATFGPPDQRNSQPMLNDKGCSLPAARRKVIAFNGNIANANELREKLIINEGILFEGETDTEVLLRLITSIDQKMHGQNASDASDYASVFRELDIMIDGACSLILIDGSGDMVLYRNSLGIRPLEYIKTDNGMLFAASETSAFIGIHGPYQTLEPGSILHYRHDTDEISLTQIANNSLRLCAMELLYFGRAGSLNSNVSNDAVRRKIGALIGVRAQEKLAGYAPEEISNISVMPVPNTAIPFAIGMSESLGLQYDMGIERQGLQRAFINATKEDRLDVLRHKFVTIEHLIRDKIVWVVDDTLIRKDTSSWVTKLLREAGAQKVEWFIGAPPFQGSCYYGIAVPDLSQLEYWNAVSKLPQDLKDRAQNGEEVREIEDIIAKSIGADSVTFLSPKLLREAMPGDSNKYCYACFNQDYPTQYGQESFSRELKGLSF
jgi:amidophosphoribosyltransferase